MFCFFCFGGVTAQKQKATLVYTTALEPSSRLHGQSGAKRSAKSRDATEKTETTKLLVANSFA